MLQAYLINSKHSIEQWLGNMLQSPIVEFEPLYESMNYSLLLGGKLIRPILTKVVVE